MLTVAAPLLAQALTFNASDSSELRARIDPESQEIAPNTGRYHWDASTQLNANLVLDQRRTSYTLSYTPAFTWLDISSDGADSSTLFHNASANATLRFKRTTLNLNQTFTYGTTNYRLAFPPNADSSAPPLDPDQPEPGGPDELLPGQEGSLNQELTTGSSTSTIALGHNLTARTTFGEFASYTYSAGFDGSEDIYPEQRSVTVGATYGYLLTPLDTLSTTLNGSVYYTEPLANPDGTFESGNRRSILATLEEAWTREWIEDLTTTLGVRANYARTEEDGELVQEVLLISIGPVGTAAVTYEWGWGGARYEATASIGSAPYVDRYTGVVDPRLYWSASLTRTKRKLTITGTVSGAESTDPETVAPLSTASALLTASYEFDERFSVRAGASASSRVVLADTVTGEDTPIPPLYYGFVGFTIALEPIQF